MQERSSQVETLLEKAEVYIKTNVDLFKLKMIDKTAEVVSSLVSKFVTIIIGALVVIMANIGLALWLGDVLGKSYYGFLLVAAFYLIVMLIVHASRQTLIKDPIVDTMISQMLNEKKYEKRETI